MSNHCCRSPLPLGRRKPSLVLDALDGVSTLPNRNAASATAAYGCVARVRTHCSARKSPNHGKKVRSVAGGVMSSTDPASIHSDVCTELHRHVTFVCFDVRSDVLQAGNGWHMSWYAPWLSRCS